MLSSADRVAAKAPLPTPRDAISSTSSGCVQKQAFVNDTPVVDYDTFLSDSRQQIQSDPLRNILMLLPCDDVTVKTVQRSTDDLCDIPKRSILPPEISPMIQFFESDWIVLDRKYDDQFTAYPDLRTNIKTVHHLPVPVFDETKRRDQRRKMNNMNSRVHASHHDTCSDDDKTASSGSNSFVLPFQEISNSEGHHINSQSATLNPSRGRDHELDTSDADEVQLNWVNGHVPFDSSSIPQLSLFHTYCDKEVTDPMETATHVPPYAQSPDSSKRVLVNFLNVVKATPEPLFFNVCLVNLSPDAMCFISEVFHFDMNDESLMELINEIRTEDIDPATTSSAAVFTMSSLSCSSPVDVHLLVRVDRMLSSDDTNTNHLTTGDDVAQFCRSRLGKFRQPFAWGLFPLFDAQGHVAAPAQHGGGKASSTPSLTLDTFYRHNPDLLTDRDLIDVLYAVVKRDTAVTRKLRLAPLHITFALAELPTGKRCVGMGVATQLTPCYGVLTQGQESNIVVREVLEFSQNATPTPHCAFYNLLYVYPLTVSFGSRPVVAGQTWRNIACRMFYMDDDRDDRPAEERARDLIFGWSTTKQFVKSAVTAVSYHQRTPSFNDEFKVQLPLKMSSRHHLLFAFSHVSCKGKSKEGEEVLIGYSVLPLTGKNCVIEDGEYNLPITTHIGRNYLVDESALKFLENKKPLFLVKLRFHTSAHTQDSHLGSFFRMQCQQNKNAESLTKALNLAASAKLDQLVRFCPVVFDQLLEIMCTTDLPGSVGRTAFRTLIRIVEKIHHAVPLTENRNPDLLAYIEYRFKNNPDWPRLPYEELVSQWLHTYQHDEPVIKDKIKYPWFLFDVIIKSIYHHLHDTGRLHVLYDLNCLREKKWLFNTVFTESLVQLTTEIGLEVKRKRQSRLSGAEHLNACFGQFLRSTMGVFERRLSFKAVQLYLASLGDNTRDDALAILKFNFLRIVASHPHFVVLNSPLARYCEDASRPRSDTPSLDFLQRHFLVHLIVREVTSALQHPSSTVRIKALTLLRDLLAKHALDPRYQTTECQARIANMYFELIPITCNILSASPAPVLTPAPTTPPSASASILVSTSRSSASIMTSHEQRILLVCVVHVFQTVQGLRETSEWIKYEGMRCFPDLVRLFTIAASAFETAGSAPNLSAKKKADDQSSSNDDTATEKRAAKSITSKSASKMFSRWKISISVGDCQSVELDVPNDQTSKSDDGSADTASDSQLAALCFSQVGSILVHIFDDLLSELVFPCAEKTECHSLLSTLLKLLYAVMSPRQSESVILCGLASLNRVVRKLPRIVFLATGPPLCDDMCTAVLSLCCSAVPSVRQTAVSMLYLMLKSSYMQATDPAKSSSLSSSPSSTSSSTCSTSSSFASVRIQTLVALSKIEVDQEATLGRALATLLMYPRMDPSVSSRYRGFVSEVEQLAQRLFVVLRDTLRLNSFQNDPDQLADMHFRIAESYMNAPDLRIAWLERIAGIHEKESNFVEAGLSLLHCAAIACECLQVVHSVSYLPGGADAFKHCSVNIQQEKQKQMTESGYGSSHSIAESGVVEFLEKAIDCLDKAKFHHMIVQASKLVIPLYEHHQHWEKLARLHGRLQNSFHEMHEQMQAGHYQFADYYKVAFYGKSFGGCDGVEYVYREKAYKMLPEMVEELKLTYEKITRIPITVLQAVHQVDVQHIPANKAYIQIVHVKVDAKPGSLDWNANAFFYETPFTPSGKTHGSLTDQWKRRYYLKTLHSFPYIIKRIRIVHQEQVELSPIEVAIEAISSRCEKLRHILSMASPDFKVLQMVLQGSVRLQVNGGPLEIAQAFLTRNASLPSSSFTSSSSLFSLLSASSASFSASSHQASKVKNCNVTKSDEDLRHELVGELKRLLMLCQQALQLNVYIMKNDQVAYHDDLQKGFNELTQKLAPFLF